jgi:hypothetical protein
MEKIAFCALKLWKNGALGIKNMRKLMFLSLKRWKIFSFHIKEWENWRFEHKKEKN